MSALTLDARQTIRDAGLTKRAYIRSLGWIGVPETIWRGDSCGCSDDRCVGFHHDANETCPCLPVLLDEARDTLCQEPRPNSWDGQRCVHLRNHEGLHQGADGGRFRANPSIAAVMPKVQE
jgi:hypothetical protein